MNTIDERISELESENERLKQAYKYIHASRNNVDEELKKSEEANAELIAALEELNKAWKVSHDKYNDWLPTGELQEAFENITALISKHKAQ